MGSSTFPLALGAGAIDDMTRDMRAEQVQANVRWLIGLARSQFEGSAARAISGCGDRASVRLRQVAIYLGHTVLGLSTPECAKALQLDRSRAVRAVQSVETQRAAGEFNSRIEQLERVVAQRLAVPQGRPVPPTQGLTTPPERDLFALAVEGGAA